MKMIISCICLVALLGSGASVYNFKPTKLDGSEGNLADYKGKVMIVVNTASKCGFTPQYAELEKFYQEYEDKGVVILGFPSNDFLRQEPGSNDEIASFCKLNYGVSFPMFEKISVKGKTQDPLYTYLTTKTLNGLEDSKVSWNFQKYVIDRNGNLVTHFSPPTSVLSDEFKKTIDDLL